MVDFELWAIRDLEDFSNDLSSLAFSKKSHPSGIRHPFILIGDFLGSFAIGFLGRTLKPATIGAGETGIPKFGVREAAQTSHKLLSTYSQHLGMSKKI